MCGRYTLTQVGPRLVGERFELGEAEIEPATLGRFNVCPTEDILVVTHKGPRAVRWGLVPSYAKSVGQGPLMINARAESVASKKVFARLLERPERRCLVIADGWYEWLQPEKKGEPRVPFRYTIDGGELFAFAGLCDVAKIDGEWVPSATILTTTANAVSAPVHDRMPVVLAGPDEEAAWMQGGDLELLGPIAARAHVGGAGEPGRQQGRASKGRSCSSRPRPKLPRHADTPRSPHRPAPARPRRSRGRRHRPRQGDGRRRAGRLPASGRSRSLGFPDKTFGKNDTFGFVSTYTYIKRGLKLEFRRGPGECLDADLDPHHEGGRAHEGGRRQGHDAQDAAGEAQGREVPHVQARRRGSASAGSAR